VSQVRELGDERYVSLETFRKNGEGVKTPVWIAPDPDGALLYVYTNRTSWKVKRIRNDSHVKLAPCTATGGVTGDWVAGRAHMIDDLTAAAPGFDAIIAKYGWQMHAGLFLSRLSGRYADRTIIEIQLGE
jgi:hypothetical protein